MSGIPPNIPPQVLMQLMQQMQQQRGMRPGQPGNMGGVLPQGPQTMPAPVGPQGMPPGMAGGMPPPPPNPGAMGGGSFNPMGGPGMGHAAYHQLRMQNPNMPAWASLSPQQQAQFMGPQNPQAMWAAAGPMQQPTMGQPGSQPPNLAQLNAQMQNPMGGSGGMGGGFMPPPPPNPGAIGGGGIGGPPPGAPAMPRSQPTPAPAPIKSFKKGGTVEKTGVYRLHKGERVIPAGKTAPARTRPSDKKTTVRHASAKSAPVKHASARHAPPPKKRK